MPIDKYNGPPKSDQMFEHLTGETIKGGLVRDDGAPILVFASGEGIVCEKDGFTRLTKANLVQLVEGRRAHIRKQNAEVERLGTLLPAERVKP